MTFDLVNLVEIIVMLIVNNEITKKIILLIKFITI